ncbi:MAG: YfiR family protein [Bacteroidota bacterium]|nr:MAG: YfiR family protein [Bacteroidota bacterium]
MKKIFLILSLAMAVQYSAHSQEEKYIGLFVYNFTKYFDWPASAKTGDFKIQVLGHKSIYDELLKLTTNKMVGTQKIVCEYIETPDLINPSANILFLGHWHVKHLDAAKAKIVGKPILLLTEYEGLLNKGSMINFIVRDGTIKFEMSKGNASRVGLQTDVRLTQLAYSVAE